MALTIKQLTVAMGLVLGVMASSGCTRSVTSTPGDAPNLQKFVDDIKNRKPERNKEPLPLLVEQEVFSYADHTTVTINPNPESALERAAQASGKAAGHSAAELSEPVLEALHVEENSEGKLETNGPVVQGWRQSASTFGLSLNNPQHAKLFIDKLNAAVASGAGEPSAVSADGLALDLASHAGALHKFGLNLEQSLALLVAVHSAAASTEALKAPGKTDENKASADKELKKTELEKTSEAAGSETASSETESNTTASNTTASKDQVGAVAKVLAAIDPTQPATAFQGVDGLTSIAQALSTSAKSEGRLQAVLGEPAGAAAGAQEDFVVRVLSDATLASTTATKALALQAAGGSPSEAAAQAVLADEGGAVGKSLRSPFDLPNTRDNSHAQSVRPDSLRAKQPLEGFPLDSLAMVGTIGKGPGIVALVMSPDKVVYRVGAGHYLGQQDGRVVGIDEGQITLVELIPDGSGGWIEQQASLVLTE